MTQVGVWSGLICLTAHQVTDIVPAPAPKVTDYVAQAKDLQPLHRDRGYAAAAARLAADSRAGSGSQPSCDQTILPDADTRANQGWS
jgi:hypothetical protein